MSGIITTQRGYEWTTRPQNLIPSLQATAFPTARVDHATIGGNELVAADILTIAGGATPPAHHTHTISGGDVNAVALDTTTIVVIGGSYTLDQFVLVDQPVAALYTYGLITGTSALTIYAVNITAGDIAFPDATVINYAVI